MSNQPEYYKSWRTQSPKRRCGFCGKSKSKSEMVSTKVTIKGVKYDVCKTCWNGRHRGRGLVPFGEKQVGVLL